MKKREPLKEQGSRDETHRRPSSLSLSRLFSRLNRKSLRFALHTSPFTLLETKREREAACQSLTLSFSCSSRAEAAIRKDG